MKFKIAASSFLLLSTLSVSAIADDHTVATVNGVAISQRSVDSFIQHRRMQPNEQTRQMVLDELIKIELLAQDAEQLKLGENEEVKETIAALSKQVLAQARLKNLTEEAEISEEKIAEAYAEKYTKNAPSEFNARHILLKDEAAAKAIITKLDEGADFAELAKTESTGPSGPNGGDLGWFEPGQMVKPFSDAVKLLEKGKYSAEPVKTKYGFHIIKLEDSRSVEVPALETVRDKIEHEIRSGSVESLISKLRETAKIEMK